MGNSASNQISMRGIGNGNLQVLITNPSYQRVVSSQSVAAIYGSTLDGNDTATLSANVMQPAYFTLGNGNDRFVGGGGPDTVHGGAGNEVIFGGQGNNAIIGGAGTDWLYGGGGDNVIYGGTGNDHIYAGSGNDMLFGGTGNDFIYGGKGTDLLEGGTGNDTLVAGSGTSYLYGGSGNDLLLGGSGTDWLFGGTGNDRIQCGAGNAVAVGGSGTAQIFGGSGSDILIGGGSFLLGLVRSDVLTPILNSWVAQKQIPPQLSDPNLAPWDNGAADLIVQGSGQTLIYAGARDVIERRFRAPHQPRSHRQDSPADDGGCTIAEHNHFGNCQSHGNSRTNHHAARSL